MKALLLALAAVLAPAPRDGAVSALAELVDDRPVAVVTIKGDFCPTCARQLASLAQKHVELDATGGAVVALSADGVDRAKALRDRLALPFAVRSVASPKVLDDVGFWMGDMPLPGVIFLDRCGAVRGTIPGRRPGTLHDDAIVSTLKKLAAERTTCSGHS